MATIKEQTIMGNRTAEAINTIIAGFILSTIIIACIAIYLWYILFSIRHLPCSHEGVLKNLFLNQHLVFNIFFILLAIGLGIENENETFCCSKKGESRTCMRKQPQLPH